MIVIRKIAAACVSFLLIILLFFLLFVTHAWAQSQGAKNIYGIHINDKEDIPLAAKLVNGESGAWGYVTIVIQSDDRRVEKWQPIFYDMMKYKLQPIVRIASKVDGSNWTRPSAEEAKAWAEFLASLYWPTDQWIVSVYNETNHGSEWGGSTDPGDYARVLREMINALDEKDVRFFILQGAFDQSTPHEPPRFYDQLKYMEEMEKAVPGIFGRLDGWASHSYPNPGFAGKPEDRGRGTIRGYEWELETLRTKFGVIKSLPVYIKETGWTYKDAQNPRIRNSIETVKDYTVRAFTDVWLKDSRVAAVTPFLLRYKGEAFSHFSWLTADNQETEVFKAVAALPKSVGAPPVSYLGTLARIAIPAQVPFDREVTASVTYKNTGSLPWDGKSKVVMSADDPLKVIVRDNFEFEENFAVLPGQAFTYRFQIKAPPDTVKATLALQLQADDSVFGEKLVAPLSVYQLPSVTLVTQNPPTSVIDSVRVGMKDARGQEYMFEPTQLPTNGSLGSFEHPLFSPNIPLNVVVSLPRRDQVSLVLTPKEGENQVVFTVPPEKNPFVLFAENFARSLRRNS